VSFLKYLFLGVFLEVWQNFAQCEQDKFLKGKKLQLKKLTSQLAIKQLLQFKF
jgi:hypothetical protein